MARFYKSERHQRAAVFDKSGKHSFSPMGPRNSTFDKNGAPNDFGMFGVQLDLRPLALALQEIPDQTMRSRILKVGMYRTLEHLKPSYRARLIVWTGINIGAARRLDKGVRLSTHYAGGMGISGRYGITDRHLSITREYFNETYSARPGQPGGLARWGKPTMWAGVKHTAWGRFQTTKKSFMIPGKKPAWFRYPRAQRFPIVRVWGPNPAKELGVHHAAEAKRILQVTAQRHFNKEIGKSYTYAVRLAKAKYGL